MFLEAVEVGGGGGFGSIFEDFFGGGQQGSTESGKRGSDLRASINITLEQAASGIEKDKISPSCRMR